MHARPSAVRCGQVPSTITRMRRGGGSRLCSPLASTEFWPSLRRGSSASESDELYVLSPDRNVPPHLQYCCYLRAEVAVYQELRHNKTRTTYQESVEKLDYTETLVETLF